MEPRGDARDMALRLQWTDWLFQAEIRQPKPSKRVKNQPANAGDAGDVGSMPGSGRFAGEGNGKPLQYSCLKNPINRGVWQAIVHGVTNCLTQLSN